MSDEPPKPGHSRRMDSGHAPNPMDNFCVEVTLGYRRLERPRRVHERGGREVLGQMRGVLGTLHENAPSEPQPTLAGLPALLARATTAAARLKIEGTPRTLPAGLELSGYASWSTRILHCRTPPGP